MQPDQVKREIARRRTFAIISHPDAGKTTLTEKLLLYGGAIEMAGAVKARRGHRSTASDWMAIEQQRGISVSSTVMRFEYRDTVLNLLDTPGHRDFSEDTYRVLTACDAAVMVLDAAKGIEDQTRKLLAVCLKRGVPVISFANKVDRPGLEPLELLDQIETEMGMTAAPMTWPVSADGAFAGLYWREQDAFIRANPGEKPPWIEGDLFSSLFEGPQSFELGQTSIVERHAEVPITFTSVADGKTTTWTDVVVLAKSSGAWKIWDVRYNATWDFKPGTNLRAVLGAQDAR